MTGSRKIVGLALAAVGLAAGTSATLLPAAAQATIPEGHPEFLINGKLASTERVPQYIYGNLELASPEESEGGTGNAVECATAGLGTVHNATEPERNTSGRNGYGEIVSWWASSHLKAGEHTERSSHCRFVEHGTNLGTERAAWLTPEQPLVEPKVEAEVCVSAGKRLLECAAPTERETEMLIKEVKREALSLPWEVELISTEGVARVRMGAPNGAERAKGHKSCEESPAPSGCIKLQVLVPELAVDESFEGGTDPRNFNGVKNGLSPSTWFFEGRAHEPCLRLASSTEKCAFMRNPAKVIGYNGQELTTIR
jgi:hypothetical protein